MNRVKQPRSGEFNRTGPAGQDCQCPSGSFSRERRFGRRNGRRGDDGVRLLNEAYMTTGFVRLWRRFRTITVDHFHGNGRLVLVLFSRLVIPSFFLLSAGSLFSFFLLQQLLLLLLLLFQFYLAKQFETLEQGQTGTDHFHLKTMKSFTDYE